MPAGDTGIIAATSTTPPFFAMCAKQFHRHYSGQPAQLNRHHRGTTDTNGYQRFLVPLSTHISYGLEDISYLCFVSRSFSLLRLYTAFVGAVVSSDPVRELAVADSIPTFSSIAGQDVYVLIRLIRVQWS